LNRHFGLRELPEFRVLDEGVVGIESGENQALHAVEEAGPLHIHLEKRAERMGDQLVGRESPALLQHATGHQVGVAILLRYVVIDVPKRILQGGTLEKPDRPVTIKTLMDKFVAITEPSLSKQQRVPILGIPIRKFHLPI